MSVSVLNMPNSYDGESAEVDKNKPSFIFLCFSFLRSSWFSSNSISGTLEMWNEQKSRQMNEI